MSHLSVTFTLTEFSKILYVFVFYFVFHLLDHLHMCVWYIQFVDYFLNFYHPRVMHLDCRTPKVAQVIYHFKKISLITDLFASLFSSYVAPEYASTGMLNERSDVYSFGILIMEIISGRNPVDYSRPAGEVCLAYIHRNYYHV